MDHVHDTMYKVYIRVDRRHASPAVPQEKLVKSCASYQEARQIQRKYRQSSRDCVIRFDGVTGGGD